MKIDSQLCSVSELTTILEQANLRVLDCSWYLPSQQRDVQAEFHEQHIPGAQFFNIDEVCDLNSELPHMLPSSQVFAQVLSSMGINNESNVVIYDSAGLFSAARVWWMFKVFGHDKVRVLDGGLPAWKNASGPLSGELVSYSKTDYQADLVESAVVDKKAIQGNCDTKLFTVLDARSAERFNGTAPEPRKGLPSGHMPESLSLPFDRLVEGGRLKPVTELEQIFDDIGINKETPLITSCGSGVTAAIITLALFQCGYGLQRLYDGAWTEWASADDTTIIDRHLFNS